MQNDLFQFLLELADDQLILGHRLSAWCGHGPQLEEDIALANIALDCIGLAKLGLELAAPLAQTKLDADQLAFFRSACEFRNCRLVEQPNGDFAMTIVRQFLFDAYNSLLFPSLKRSKLPAIADFATRGEKETLYHLRHSRAWLVRLGDGTEESRSRCETALTTLWPYTEELFRLTTAAEQLQLNGLEIAVVELKTEWNSLVVDALSEATLLVPEGHIPDTDSQSQVRNGARSLALPDLLAEMQSTARSFPGASW